MSITKLQYICSMTMFYIYIYKILIFLYKMHYAAPQF